MSGVRERIEVGTVVLLTLWSGFVGFLLWAGYSSFTGAGRSVSGSRWGPAHSVTDGEAIFWGLVFGALALAFGSLPLIVILDERKRRRGSPSPAAGGSPPQAQSAEHVRMLVIFDGRRDVDRP